MASTSGEPAGADVRLDDGNLPSWVCFPSGTPPGQYGAVFVAGYGRALANRATEVFARGGWDAFNSLPTRRQDLERYLSTTTWDEYIDAIGDSFGGTFQAQSRFRDVNGKPGIALTGDDGTLTGIEVSAEWAITEGAGIVANEIVSCASDIRRQREQSHGLTKWGDLSDDQLEERFHQHLENLLIEQEA
ncbi:hypothetical protein [Mycobacteroides chelonae]|uniref:hypothetical protein n=1 Tax=Mycobacteroides chelonae TaxID=1774 RepID=UPI000AB18463|nr:hypothetical protein [Mycobacteroides chelonae]MBF9318054.1 hypothetical protein [Mycobacteroides chelonae]